MKHKKIIMVMVDGFGVPIGGWRNSQMSRYLNGAFLDLLENHSVPIDANLGIKGIPQSATGQSTLFTGINTAESLGRHIQGFPGKKLRDIIRRRNLFSSLIKKGGKVTFANAYVKFDLEGLRKTGLRSVTTVMTEYALGYVRQTDDLINGNAVYHDLTRETICSGKRLFPTGEINDSDTSRIKKEIMKKPAFSIPLVSASQAARDLNSIAKEHDFTLFEYFMTDRAGHKKDDKSLRICLENLNEFVNQSVQILPEDVVFILTADHGNCEDFSTGKHTRNPVPFLVYKTCRNKKPEVTSLVDVFDYVISVYDNSE